MLLLNNLLHFEEGREETIDLIILCHTKTMLLHR